MKKQTLFLFGIVSGVVLFISPLELSACKKVKEENAELRYELDAADLRITELETQLQEQQRGLDVRNQEMAGMQNQIDLKNNELQRLYDEVEILEKDVFELTDTLKMSGDALSGQIVQLSQKNQDLESQVLALKADIDAASRRNERFSNLVDEYEKRISKLSMEIANLKAERAKLLAVEAIDKERMKETYDQLLKSLEKEIGQQVVDIQQYRDALTINIMDKIFFDSGKAEIKQEGFDVLRRVGAILKNVPDKTIRIEGHTDDIPIGQKIIEKYPTNWELGAARAANVAEFFRKDVGIDPKRMSVVSYSMYRPIVPHTTKENRAKNRRIEIILLDKLYYQMVEVKESLEQ
jgi:chemotaxis protein MotB